MIDNPLRVVGLRAEKIKRIEAVEITPDPHMVIIGGRNGQGKSSLLDSIEWALAGRGAQKGVSRPIRDGETEAVIVVDLGELIVERHFSGDRQSLIVRAADGSRLQSAQAVLDALTGEMSFDPLVFASKPEKAQRDMLLAAVGLLDLLATLDADRKIAFDERTDRARYLRTVQARIEEVPKVDVPTDLSVADAARAYTEGMAITQANNRTRARFTEATVRLHQLDAQVAALLVEQDQGRIELSNASDAVAAQLPDPDVEVLRDQLDNAEGAAQQIVLQRRRADMVAEAEGIEDDVAQLTEAIGFIDSEKLRHLAGAPMPVDGLSVDEEGITYQGVPFAQCSAAERLRVSVGIAMATNPRIRVVRISDGSLLDADNMALIAGMAEEHDFQVFVERVGDRDPAAIIIEDGRVLAP